MNPRVRALLQLGILIAVVGLLMLVFPAVFRFVEMAARELRYLWWLILLVVLAVWLIWGAGKKPRK